MCPGSDLFNEPSHIDIRSSLKMVFLELWVWPRPWPMLMFLKCTKTLSRIIRFQRVLTLCHRTKVRKCYFRLMGVVTGVATGMVDVNFFLSVEKSYPGSYLSNEAHIKLFRWCLDLYDFPWEHIWAHSEFKRYLKIFSLPMASF